MSEIRDTGAAVLITGAAGYVGRIVTRQLAESPGGIGRVIATDVRDVPTGQRLPGVEYARLDVAAGDVGALLERYGVGTVVHLAAVVTPPPGDSRERQYSVDVLGTRNVMDACVRQGVRRVVITSSGAAYGYHPQNPALLSEDDPLRGDDAFAYAWHKRLVEEDLARYREEHPDLEQVIFRVCTVLGPDVSNQITAMFERPVVVGLRGAETPFCFAWDEDVAGCLVAAVRGGPAGIYNLSGDGVMTLREIARAMGRPFVALPERAVRFALDHLSRRGLSPYGPEQTMFLRHRPVLGNERLKRRFGYVPRKSSRQVFDHYCRSRSRSRGVAARA